MITRFSMILALCTSFTSNAWAQQEIDSDETASKTLTATLETSRPKIRPGEWFTLAFLVENTSGEGFTIGPPDDGIRGEKALEEQESLLRWETDDSESYDLVPDMLSVQWPRTTPFRGQPERHSCSATQDLHSDQGDTGRDSRARLKVTFSVSGMDLETSEPFSVTQTVAIQIVHPTDPEATDMLGVNPRLFAEWRGDIPDWTVQDTRVSRPKKGAPTLAWLVFAVPLCLVDNCSILGIRDQTNVSDRADRATLGPARNSNDTRSLYELVHRIPNTAHDRTPPLPWNAECGARPVRSRGHSQQHPELWRQS